MRCKVGQLKSWLRGSGWLGSISCFCSINCVVIQPMKAPERSGTYDYFGSSLSGLSSTSRPYYFDLSY